MENGTTMQQCGSDNIIFTCPKVLQINNFNTGNVDLVDIDKKIGRSFTYKSHLKNGTKKNIGIFDFMLVIGCAEWNESPQLKGIFRIDSSN